MNEYERAIEWFEKQNAYYSEKETYQEDFRMNGLALIALRAQAERMNPKPLTVEQIKQRIGKPVWVTHKDGSGGRWGIVNEYEHPHGLCADYESGSAMWFDEFCGTIAYRYPPKEEV